MKRIDFYLALVIFLISFLFFGHTLPYPFINLDDQNQILENPFIKTLSWPVVWDLFSRFYFGQYNPLTLLSFVLDYSIWNADPYGFRLTDLIFHALNGILIYFLLRKMKASVVSSFTVSFLF